MNFHKLAADTEGEEGAVIANHVTVDMQRGSENSETDVRSKILRSRSDDIVVQSEEDKEASLQISEPTVNEAKPHLEVPLAVPSAEEILPPCPTDLLTGPLETECPPSREIASAKNIEDLCSQLDLSGKRITVGERMRTYSTMEPSGHNDLHETVDKSQFCRSMSHCFSKVIYAYNFYFYLTVFSPFNV